MRDDLTISIANTWLESDDTDFNRVVVLRCQTVTWLLSDQDSHEANTVQRFRERLISKLEADLGLIHQKDYIVDSAGIHSMMDGVWSDDVIDLNQTKIKLKKDEHFTMLKLHYNGN